MSDGTFCLFTKLMHLKLANSKEHSQLLTKEILAGYLEGYTAPMRDENPLHAANVELIARLVPRN